MSKSSGATSKRDKETRRCEQLVLDIMAQSSQKSPKLAAKQARLLQKLREHLNRKQED